MGMEKILELITAVAAGISCFCFFRLLFDFFAEFKLDSSLDAESTKALPLILRPAMPFVPNFRFMARAKSLEATRNRADELITSAGYDLVLDGVDFLAARIVLTIFGAIFLFLCVISGKALLGLILFMCLYIYPPVWLKKTVDKRHMEIVRSLPNVLDLLTLSVEAGKDFLTALRDILARKKVRDALCEELDRTFKEIQLGKSRREALRDLSNRVRQADLTAVMNAIIQADELGVSIAGLLRIQGDLLRNKRFVRAEKLANEAPVKILGPVILFIFPAVIMILMVPVMMQAFKVLA